VADQELLAKLQAENARLIALLESRGIDWRPPPAAPQVPSEPSRLSSDDKVALFRRLFRGRTDVYPIRWESKTTGKPGYAPACANEWRLGVLVTTRVSPLLPLDVHLSSCSRQAANRLTFGRPCCRTCHRSYCA